MSIEKVARTKEVSGDGKSNYGIETRDFIWNKSVAMKDWSLLIFLLAVRGINNKIVLRR